MVPAEGCLTVAKGAFGACERACSSANAEGMCVSNKAFDVPARMNEVCQDTDSPCSSSRHSFWCLWLHKFLWHHPVVEGFAKLASESAVSAGVMHFILFVGWH